MRLFPENDVNRYWKSILLWMVVLFFPHCLSLQQPAAQPSCLITASVFGLFWRAVRIVWWWSVRKSKAMIMQCRFPSRREKCSPDWVNTTCHSQVWRLLRVPFSVMHAVGGWEIQGWGRGDVSEDKCYHLKGIVPEQQEFYIPEHRESVPFPLLASCGIVFWLFSIAVQTN